VRFFTAILISWFTPGVAREISANVLTEKLLIKHPEVRNEENVQLDVPAKRRNAIGEYSAELCALIPICLSMAQVKREGCTGIAR
jgi:hypothetical protein